MKTMVNVFCLFSVFACGAEPGPVVGAEPTVVAEAAAPAVVVLPGFREAAEQVRTLLHEAAGCAYTAKKYYVTREVFPPGVQVGIKLFGMTTYFANNDEVAVIHILPLVAGGEIQFDTDGYPVGLPITLWQKVLVHEFGHASGLEHTEDPTNIMTQGMHSEVTLDQAIYQVTRHIKCAQ